MPHRSTAAATATMTVSTLTVAAVPALLSTTGTRTKASPVALQRPRRAVLNQNYESKLRNFVGCYVACTENDL